MTTTIFTVDSGRTYAQSRALAEKAKNLIPGGHHLSGRPLLVGEDSPQYMVRGKGARCWDVDGNDYLDYIGAYGPFLLGYANESVDAAACAQLRQGNLLSLNHPLHLELAERLLSRFPGADMAVLLKTGSEATTAALRIARKHTGRRRVVRCGYHGWHDWCLPVEPFVPSGLGEQVLELDVSNPASLEALLSAAPNEFAAVIIAPEMILPTRASVFHDLLATTHRHGAVFVLDEIKTALRIKPGSFQQHVGIVPDLTTVSKALGNGWPIAAVLGQREVMSSAAGMHLSATFHGETAAMAAALATLENVNEHPVADYVWALGEQLIEGLNAAAKKSEVPAVAFGEPLPPMPFLKFTTGDTQVNERVKTTFYREMMRHGILLHPRHMWFISYAHTAEDIAFTVRVAEHAFGVAREELEKTA